MDSAPVKTSARAGSRSPRQFDSRFVDHSARSVVLQRHLPAFLSHEERFKCHSIAPVETGDVLELEATVDLRVGAELSAGSAAGPLSMNSFGEGPPTIVAMSSQGHGAGSRRQEESARQPGELAASTTHQQAGAGGNGEIRAAASVLLPRTDAQPRGDGNGASCPAAPLPPEQAVSVVRTSDAGPERENTLNPNAPQRMTSLHRMKTDGKGSPGKSSAMQRLRRMVTGVQGQTEQEADMRQAELVEGGASEHKRVEWSQVLKHLQREKKRATARAEEHYVNRSLYCLESSSTVRERVIKFTELPMFNAAILFLIILNCVTLIFEDPVCACSGTPEQPNRGGVANAACRESEMYSRLLYQTRTCDSWPTIEIVLGASEYFFTVVFTVEVVMKIVARGLLMHKHAYLKDSWNRMDLIIVLAGLLSVALPSTPALSFLRTFRVLRPLRTMTRIKGMKPLINTFMRSFAEISKVVTLLFFFTVFYGILGIELLSKDLRGRCYVDPSANRDTLLANPAVYGRLISQQTPFKISEDVCAMGNVDHTGGPACGDVALDGVKFVARCSVYKVCIDASSAHRDVAAPGDAGPTFAWCTHDMNENPFWMGGGYFSYDNFGSAFLSILQTLTMEGWVDLMYAHGIGYNPGFSFFFHITWVLIASFTIIQLALASLSKAFMDAKEEDEHAIEREALSEQALLQTNLRESTLLRSLTHGDTGLDRMQSHAALHHLSFIAGGRRAVELELEIEAHQAKNGWGWQIPTFVRKYFAMFRVSCAILVGTKSFEYFILAVIVANTGIMFWTYHDQQKFELSICQRRCDLDASLPANASARCMGPLFNRTWVSDGAGTGMRPTQQAYCFLRDDGACSQHTTRGACINAASALHNGLGCYFFAASSSWDMTYKPQASDAGKCRAGLYTASEFVGEGGMALSLRQVCGDDGEDCPAFDKERALVFETVIEVLTWVFVVEMLLKMLGKGLQKYFEDGYNRFDFLVVLTSLIEYALTKITEDGGQGLSVLRGARLLRLLKLALRWKHMRTTINTLKTSLVSLKPLMIVWLLFMYILGLLGMQLFGAHFRFVKTDAPRSNFDSFGPYGTGQGAFITIFQIISTENWNMVLYNAATAGGREAMDTEGPYKVALPILVVLFGNYIIMNLFISILLQGFGADDEEESHQDGDSPRIDGPHSLHRPPDPETYPQRMRKAFFKLLGRDLMAKVQPTAPAAHEEHAGSLSLKHHASLELLAKRGSTIALVDSSQVLATQEHEASIAQKGGFELAPAIQTTLCGYPVELNIPRHKALGILGVDNVLRKCLSFLVHHAVFENFIIICIFCSSITLIIEVPDDWIVGSAHHCPSTGLDCSNATLPGHTIINCERHANSPDFGRVFPACGMPGAHACCGVVSKNAILKALDITFLSVFVVEMVLKVLADGFVFHPNAYLRNRWNWLDFAIVIISVVSASNSGDGNRQSALKAIRCVRALRPLRVVKRVPGLRIIVLSFLKSLPEVAQTAMVVFVWFVFFGMIGVNFFKGKAYYCYDPQNQIYFGTSYNQAGPLYTTPPAQSGLGAVPTIIECVSAEGGGVGVWHSKHYSFDTVWEAILTLFEMTSTEGWVEVLASTVDVVQVGVTPIPNFQYAYAWYSLIHIVVGSFILLNLIVGNVIGNYIKIKNEETGILQLMTKEQKDWAATQHLMLEMKPKLRQQEPTHPIRRYCFRLVSHDNFDLAITGIILANIFTMMLQTHDQWRSSGVECWTSGMFWVNCLFTGAFILECTIKLLGLGPRWYFLNWWNVFDFIVVALSILTLAIDIITKEYQCLAEPAVAADIGSLGWLSSLRVIRLARVFRLIRKSKGLRQMIRTLLISLPSMAYISVLILIVMVIFSVLSTTFFYNINTGQDTYEFMDNDFVNYKNFGNSMMMLFRHTTGEAWNGMMYYASEDQLYLACEKAYGEYLGDGCGGGGVGPAAVVGRFIHLTWTILATYMLMQLFTAVIIETFDEQADADKALLSLDKLNEFVDAWTSLDPMAQETISTSQLEDLILLLHPPLGLKTESSSRVSLLRVIKDLDIPILPGDPGREGVITYHDTFKACVRRVLADVDEEEEENEEEDADSKRDAQINNKEEGVSGSGAAGVRSAGCLAWLPKFGGAKAKANSAPSPAAAANITLKARVTGREGGGGDMDDFSQRKATAAEDYAARSVQLAYREFREKKLQVFKGTRRTNLIQLNSDPSDIRT